MAVLDVIKKTGYFVDLVPYLRQKHKHEIYFIISRW